MKLSKLACKSQITRSNKRIKKEIESCIFWLQTRRNYKLKNFKPKKCWIR